MMICTQCYATGEPRVKSSAGGAVLGVLALGAFLFLFFVPIFPADMGMGTKLAVALGVPFLILLLGMSSGRTKACASCGAAALVPLDSPRGRELQNRK